MKTNLGFWIFKGKGQKFRGIGNSVEQKNVQYFELHYFGDETHQLAQSNSARIKLQKELIVLNGKIH